MAGQTRRPHAPVYFNDALFAADVARLPQRGRLALQAARARYERDGVRADDAATATWNTTRARSSSAA